MIGLLLLLVGVTMWLGNAWRLSVPTPSFEVREVARDGTVSWTPGRFSQRVHILRWACVSCRWGRLTARMEKEASWRQCWDRLVPVRTGSLSCGAGTLARVARGGRHTRGSVVGRIRNSLK